MIVGLVWGSVANAATLAGVVSDTSGQPVEGADVTVYANGDLPVGVAVTGADGAWEVQGLDDGRYRVLAQPPAEHPDAEAWAPSAPDRCAADGYDVTDEATATADTTLLAGVELTGELLLPDGAPATGAVVTARPETGQRGRTAVVGDDGRFVVRGLPPVGVTITFDASPTPIQYWGGVFDEREAWVLSVGADLPSDLGPYTLLEAASLSGTVTGPAGPATGGTVELTSEGQKLVAAIGPDGTWTSARLPPGSVLVQLDVSGLAAVYWPDLDRPGDKVEVASGERLEGIDLTAPLESRVRGELAGAPWYAEGAVVVLHNDDESLTLGATVGVDGTFQYTRLSAGDYTIWLDGRQNGGLAGYLRDEEGKKLVIPVAEGEIVELGVLDLEPAGRIEGTVVDAASGAPVIGGYVVARPTGTTTGAGAEEAFALTDRKGWYGIDGLAEGAYEVRAGYESPCPTDREWVTTWHPGTPNDLFASLVEVRPGEVARWSARLPSDDDHDGMGDRWERANGLDPAVDDAAGDPDEDGFDNLAEYLLDTDPTDRPDRRGPRAEGCGCGGSAPSLAPSLGLVAALLCLRRRSRA